MTTHLTIRSALALLTLSGLTVSAGAQSAQPAQPAQAYPKTIVADAEASGSGAKLTATVTIRINRLMYDHHFKRAAEAFKYGGYTKFLPALRALPPIGYVEVVGRQTQLKYARERTDGKPVLVLGTDRPIYFVGFGAPDAQEKEKMGYQLGIIELELDAQGGGTGTMAAAAKVKPGPDGGVIITDFATSPIELKVKSAK
jgi:hypothetical protein